MKEGPLRKNDLLLIQLSNRIVFHRRCCKHLSFSLQWFFNRQASTIFLLSLMYLYPSYSPFPTPTCGPIFQNYALHLKMEAERSSETVVSYCNTVASQHRRPHLESLLPWKLQFCIFSLSHIRVPALHLSSSSHMFWLPWLIVNWVDEVWLLTGT